MPILLPGFSTAYLMHVLGRCQTTIAKWKAEAQLDPELAPAVRAAMCTITPADGMLMARLRGSCQMPFWSRLALVDYRKQGYEIGELARSFMCAPRTVSYVVQRGMFLNPDRVLTRWQKSPPARKLRVQT